MDVHSGHVLTLANSIIGVSILAMPYCFKQCGILLAIIIILLSNLLTRLACHFLIKSAVIARRKTFEYLAYYIFGGVGKFAIEVGMIGFLIGTCIAFFVVMGDLGPEIISEITGQDTTSTMRSTILLALALFCVLPLGLLKNIDSLAGVSKATIGFYFCLVIKIVIDALPHIYYGDWISKVEFWRPAGIIQCLPIFSMALSCQTQLFEIYQVVHNPTLEKMNHVIKNAVNICTLVYFFVGFFGYIAFANKNFTGNILLSFAPSFVTNIIKLGFIMSVACSFPLVIFPCRASVHSLIYRQGVSIHEGVSDYIPEGRFKGLTFTIVFISLVVGILIPNIEFVLGLVGSSIGIMICILFPVICFISVSQKNTNERLLAKVILVIGMIVMILGTYENLHHLENIQTSLVVTNLDTEKRELKLLNLASKDITKDIKNPTGNPNNLNENVIKQGFNQTKVDKIKATDSPEIRHEPPQPVEPQDSQPDSEIEQAKKKKESQELLKININVELETKEKVNDNIKKDKIVENDIGHPENLNTMVIQPIEKADNGLKFNDNNHLPNNLDKIKNDDVDIEAIKKDDKETLLQEKEVKDPHLEEHKILIDKIEKQNKVQQAIVEQQKKLIEVIEKQQEQKVKEEKLKAEIKAVKEIESIALKAIEKISGDAKQNEQIVAELEKDVRKKVSAKESALESNNNHNNSKSQENSKIEQLKLMNNLLSAKIKQNNITQKPVIESKDGGIHQRDLSQNVLQDTNINNIIKTHTRNNTAPLLVNLGQNVNNESNKNPVKGMLPLPLVVSFLQQQNGNFNISKNLMNAGKVRSTDKPESKTNIDPVEDVKLMRRDILEYLTSRRRR